MVSAATNLGIRNVLKIKTKKKKNIRKQKKIAIKTENLMGYATTAAEKGMWVRTVGSRSMAIIKNSRKQKKLLIGMRMTWFHVY